MCRSFDLRRRTNVQTDERKKIENPGVGRLLLDPAKIYTDHKEKGKNPRTSAYSGKGLAGLIWSRNSNSANQDFPLARTNTRESYSIYLNSGGQNEVLLVTFAPK